MKPMLFLAVFLLMANVAVAQPVPLPRDGPAGSSITTYDAQGQGYTTFKTPTGAVTYGPGGERFDTFETPSGGTVTYGPGGERWETVPGPATPSSMYSSPMPQRSSRKKEPRDINELAYDVVRSLTSEEPITEPAEEKNPHAVALGRLGGLKGGPARKAQLSAKRRKEIAKKAAAARWATQGRGH